MKKSRISRNLFLFTAIALLSCSESNDIRVINLECEYLLDPMGIDAASPRLGWKIIADRNNVKQKAYRILAASTFENLAKNFGDLWDSDTVLTDRSSQIVYDGVQLVSRQKVFWKVKVWDQENTQSEWSNVSSWEMGLLNSSDWKAKWIGKNELEKPIAGQNNPAPYFRKEFQIVSKPKNSRVYITGLGYYQLYINGKKIGDHVLSPNQTNYDRRQENSFENDKIANMSTRILYQTFNISEYLTEGKNVAAVVLGNGWYFQTERKEYLPMFYDTPRFITQIEIDYKDGSKTEIVSDESWKTGIGPIMDNNLYIGEVYDARFELDGWNKLEYNDSKWDQAKIVRSPEGKLSAQMSPPDRVIESLRPISIENTKENTFRYDFGTMFSGWIKLKLKGERGAKVQLTYFEDSGNSYGQTDTYIMKGDEIEEWQPRFTWHSFRYVEISGLSSAISLENIVGKIVHTDVNTFGDFESSNLLFNRIASDYKKTQLDNMHGGVTTDCPHRERRGYTGDAQIAAQAAIYSLDMRSFYTKWLNDIADAQNKVTGYVPNTVPYHSGGGGVAWGSAYIIIPWYMYLYYGDVGVLEDHYEGMRHFIKYLENRIDKDGLIHIDPNDYWDLGEWVPPDPTEIPRVLVASAYYYYDLVLLSKISSVLGKKDEADRLLEKSELVKLAFNKKFYDSENKTYSIGRQGANIFPLAFGLVPEDKIDGVFKSLAYNIEVNTRGFFDTGMLATPYLLEVLTKYGRADLAYTVMNRRDYPSFGYNIERGATTLWETWRGNDSHSHPMFGSVIEWFYKTLAGINPDEVNPGFKHIIIKPSIIGELDFVNGSYSSEYGKIISNWKLDEELLTLKVKIPPNTTASVFIPGRDNKQVLVDEKNVEFISADHGLLHYEIQSGEYTFISKEISKYFKTLMLSIPVIDPSDSTLFVPDSLYVNIRQYSKNAEIRYTLDGTEPSQESFLFTEPFLLKESKVIKARTFSAGSEPSFTKTNRIAFIDSLKNGLDYKYYVEAWNRLPEFDKYVPVRTGKVYNFDLDEFINLDEKFGIVFNGLIEIKTSGIYNFLLISNDGSKLFIDDKLIFNTEKRNTLAREMGKVELKEGKHKIKLEYFQAGGGKGLQVYYQGPDIDKQLIPADILLSN